MPKSKKFIDRKHSVTFHLVHRSQQDPLAADDTAPQRVLLPVQEKSNPDVQKRREEQTKYGIFYDDEYNYLQHLRDSNQISVEWEQVERIEAPAPRKLNLPSSVFASEVEEDVGLLNKAAPHSGPRLDLDPDIVAAMDDDFDFEDPNNELEDNFIELANAEGPEQEFEGSDFGSDFDDYSDEENDEVGSLEGPQRTFADEETKSRFTEYSMSSSVMRRNEQLTLLDDRFEKLYSGYDDTEIGALDSEEIEGFVDPNSELLLQCADEFERDQKREQLERESENAHLHQRCLQESSDSEDDDQDLVQLEVKDNKEKWDCESILSTYSNIYNHPKLISEPKNNQKIKIDMRTGMPLNVLGQNKLTAKALSQLNAGFDSGPKSVCAKSVISAISTLSIRPKDETPEDRKIRKLQLKEYRRERRLEKKANAEAFKEEAKRQVKIAMNNRNNVQGNRIL